MRLALRTSIFRTARPQIRSFAMTPQLAAGQTASGRGTSHAKPGDSSYVPQGIQEELPESVERAVPNAIHDTGNESSGLKENMGIGKSHAKPGGSVLPEGVQKVVPEKLERAVPNAVHDTGDKKVRDP